MYGMIQRFGDSGIQKFKDSIRKLREKPVGRKKSPAFFHLNFASRKNHLIFFICKLQAKNIT
jgi:hypothetical protein